jgi:glycosyltransferase involved in cell wall biosynthesis
MKKFEFDFHTRSHPKISIVISYYNQLNFAPSLCDNIDSYLSDEIEILLMDDCSTDESHAYLSDRLSARPNVRVIRHEKNIGVLKNATAGLMAAQGEYLIFSAGDDFLNPKAISDLLDRVNSNADIYMCKGIRENRDAILGFLYREKNMDSAIHLNQHIFQKKWNNSNELLALCATQPGFIWTQCICYRRSVAMSAGFMPEGGIDDWGLWHNIACHAKQQVINIELMPIVLAFVSVTPGSLGSDHFSQTQRQISAILTFWSLEYRNEALINASIKKLNACRGNRDTEAAERTIALMAKIIHEIQATH